MNMWSVKYKPNNDSQPWSTLDTYDSRAWALIHAARISGDCFMVEVVGPEGNVIWSN